MEGGPSGLGGVRVADSDMPRAKKAPPNQGARLCQGTMYCVLYSMPALTHRNRDDNEGGQVPASPSQARAARAGWDMRRFIFLATTPARDRWGTAALPHRWASPPVMRSGTCGSG